MIYSVGTFAWSAVVTAMATTSSSNYVVSTYALEAGGLMGTGMAQQGIGASGMGIIAEKPEKFGQVLIFFVIPETLWIIGLVLGYVLLKAIL